jgi:hypothetical protein
VAWIATPGDCGAVGGLLPGAMDGGMVGGLSIESLDSVLASSMDPIDYLLTVHSGDACLLTGLC